MYVCILIILIIILVLVLVTIGYSINNSCNSDNSRRNSDKFNLYNRFKIGGKKVKFAQKEDSGWQLYMRKGCPHCVHQKAELKNFTNYIEYAPGGAIVENRINPGEDILPFGSPQLRGYPAWRNIKTGEIKMGKQNVFNLTPQISGEGC